MHVLAMCSPALHQPIFDLHLHAVCVFLFQALLSWMNSFLPSDKKASNLSSDLASGIRISLLLHAISGVQAPRLVANPRLPVQKFDNWRSIQSYMKSLGMGEQRQQLQGMHWEHLHGSRADTDDTCMYVRSLGQQCLEGLKQ